MTALGQPGVVKICWQPGIGVMAIRALPVPMIVRGVSAVTVEAIRGPIGCMVEIRWQPALGGVAI